MRISNQKKLIVTGFRELTKGLYTQIPGHILSFDSATQLAQLQIGIVGVDEDGTFEHAAIIECPVHFTGGSDWSIEHKIEEGDEGMIFFSQRCVDAWIQTGGVAQNPTLRFHDKQDAFFLAGFRSKPNVITDFQNNGVRIRNKDASIYTWLKGDGTIESTNASASTTIKPDGTIESKNSSATNTLKSSGAIESVNSAGHIKLLASGAVDINGFIITATGAATSPVSIGAPLVSASASMTVAGAEMKEHKHTAGTYKAGNTPVTGKSGESS